jgi:purine-cytosine permease-like protein
MDDVGRRCRGGGLAGGRGDFGHASGRRSYCARIGVLLLVVAFGGLITATSLNFYGASLTLLSIADSFVKLRNSITERVVSLGIVTVLASALSFSASENFIHDYELLLSVLLYIFTPWTAINLIDFYFVRHCEYSIKDIFDPDGIYGRWNMRGIIAYIAGFVVMIPFFSTHIFTGPVARELGGADVSMLVGLPVSAVAYLFMCRNLKENNLNLAQLHK